MHRAAELKVSATADDQLVEPSLLAADGEQIRQRLRGVIMSAVARVDDGHGADLAAAVGAPSLG